jgi:hypothetical protein
MTKRPTTITYTDTHTGRTHRLNAEVAPGATRKDVAAAIERDNGMTPGRVRITRGV